MTGPLLVAGVAIQAIAWRLVALGRAPFWPVVAGTWAVVGAATLAFGRPGCCDPGLVATLVVGIVSGLLLYGATRIVVTFATRWPVLARAVEGTYGRSVEVPTALVWILTLALVVSGEELFWRGVVTPALGDAAAPPFGAFLAWLAYVGVAAAWSSLPFLAAAFVGGALWTALAAWSGGVVSPLASHIVWTACMLAWRPPTGRAKVAS